MELLIGDIIIICLRAELRSSGGEEFEMGSWAGALVLRVGLLILALLPACPAEFSVAGQSLNRIGVFSRPSARERVQFGGKVCLLFVGDF